MNLAMFKVMALDLWRDRAALIMAFLLPPLVFVIFAGVFTGATAIDVKLKVAVADLAHTPNSGRLVAALLADKDLRAQAVKPPALAAVGAMVRSGEADAGVVVRGDPAGPGSPLLILADPSRAVAEPLTEARIQDVLSRVLPDILLARTIGDVAKATGPLSAEQRQNVAMAERELVEDPGVAAQSEPLFASLEVTGARRGGGTTAYYAGAVTILFALFTAMHGALTLIEERRSGIADRILAGQAGLWPVVTGKLLFLIAQAAVQAAAIFATAQLVYDVPVVQHLALWLATTFALGLCAGGLALAMVSVCRTREQAQMLSTFVILILAAIGGSMVPRFLMPPWLQTVGWLTPHAWVIDAYQGLLWRDEGPETLYRSWLVMTAIGLFGFLFAQAVVRRVRI
ncbi:MAG: ABC transporter permease [Caulobacteraceae bacterium]|nr:ABC transporter permease [Caulobacteraceae bacterium]